MKQLLQNQQNPQNKRKKLINFIVMILTILIVFTACHKKKKPFLLLPLIDNSSVASTDGGSGGPTFTQEQGILNAGNGGSGDSGSGNGGSGGGGSGGPTFTPAQGILDDSFGSPNGYIIQPVSIGSSNDYGYSLAIQPDGKILLGGYCYNGSNDDFCIARFNSNGTLDTSFGSSGQVIQDIGSSNDDGISLAIQPNGNILLGGYCLNGSNNDFCIARFK